jgi:hypothetical protein
MHIAGRMHVLMGVGPAGKDIRKVGHLNTVTQPLTLHTHSALPQPAFSQFIGPLTFRAFAKSLQDQG